MKKRPASPEPTDAEALSIVMDASDGTVLDHALVAAAKEGDVDSVKQFLAMGAGVSFTTAQGDSALGVARKGRHGEVAALLEARGATVARTATVKRAVPAPPTLRDETCAVHAALVAQLSSKSGEKRGAAANDMETAADPAFAAPLVAALAHELRDTRKWPSQQAMIDALGATSAHPEVAAWLERIVVERWFDPTAVNASLGRATFRIAVRAGVADVDRLLARLLDEIPRSDQRLGACVGVLAAAHETETAIGPDIAARVGAFVAEPGALRRQEQGTLLDAKREWARVVVRR